MCQNFIIIALIWKYNKSIGTLEKLTAAAIGLGYAYLLFGIPQAIPDDMWGVISSSNSILSKYLYLLLIWSFVDIIAKLPQLISNFKMKSTG